ncbi:MAG: hypothetical protein N2327_06735 [Caldimicrobium sp.]|nr:hypothetical protein [Caldimicrobium sp.]MCX7874108.1 hypothetical protein [Caldimicrobium sp.]MDW8093757.1 hypothetical protein [Caldimicrobium sp.]
MDKNLILYLLIILDLIILVFLLVLYFKFKRVLTLPWEDIESSLEKAQSLVAKLQELKSQSQRIGDTDKQAYNVKEEVILLYNKGLGIKEIAKRLGLSEGEVEIILKRREIS